MDVNIGKIIKCLQGAYEKGAERGNQQEILVSCNYNQIHNKVIKKAKILYKSIFYSVYDAGVFAIINFAFKVLILFMPF